VPGRAPPRRLLVDAGGRQLPLVVRRPRRARRITLRLVTDADELRLTLPPRTSLAAGLALVERHREWIAERLRALPPRVAFADGASIPLLGKPCVICHRRDAIGVQHTDGVIAIGGRPERLAIRLTAWLRMLAEAEFTRRSAELAARLGRTPGRVRVRGMRSRWGSCSPTGDLSYNWRLIFAPEVVRDYVAAHEVAHLVEKGHTAAFWRTATSLARDIDAARRWLRRHGHDLLRYG
jgi:predicted metal-dependent hydrolase